MPTHTSRTLLRAPPAAVYDYLTRPACWHEWHAASLGAQAHARESLRAGDRFDENIRTAGFHRQLHWRVLDAVPPKRWEASASMSDGSTAHLLYEFAAAPGGTQFTRSLSYSVRPRWLRWFSVTLGAVKIRVESRQALKRLQQHFERDVG